MNDVGSTPGAAERDRSVRRARRLRTGVVATGVAGSLGIAGVAAVTTIAGRASSDPPPDGALSIERAVQPQQAAPQRLVGSDDSGHVTEHSTDGAEHEEGEDDGGRVVQPRSHQLFQQPQPPAPGGGTVSHATSSGS